METAVHQPFDIHRGSDFSRVGYDARDFALSTRCSACCSAVTNYFLLLGTLELHTREKSSKYAAILWLISSHLDHEVLRTRNVEFMYRRRCRRRGLRQSVGMVDDIAEWRRVLESTP